jgi:hypothetical protein
MAAGGPPSRTETTGEFTAEIRLKEEVERLEKEIQMNRRWAWGLYTFAALGLPLQVSVAGTGDCDGDCDVDLTDFAAFQLCFSGPGGGLDDGCGCADLDNDGDVDLNDFNGFQLAFSGPGGVATVRELAGNSLGEYPFYEYVRAFNDNATVEMAVNPDSEPTLIGATCDVYIVEAKSAGDWAADPSLIDATNAVETHTFVAGTIQANTVVAAGAGELDSDAGFSFGHPYDMVLDCDQDGELSEGDFIDGLCGEAGLFSVHDITLPGPLAVTAISPYSVAGISSGQSFEVAYHPTNIGDMGEVPMIVASHGNGHQFTWYGHIGEHMASYGYVTMSHQNNTGPGVFTASQTTLEHTDSFIGQLGAIGGGAMDGHVDSSRIVWIGHSRGAEGVAIGYDRVFDGAYTPANYGIDDIVLVSSIAPTDFLGVTQANPHDAIYHLWVGAADNDVHGCASNPVAQSFALHDRATDIRQSISLHGAGHGDFHNGGGSSVASGPCLIGRATTHTIMRGYFLPLVEHYVHGNLPAKDFLWRQYEHFAPISAPTANPCVHVDLVYRDTESAAEVIDNYQTETSLNTSSSGGAVTFNVSNVSELRLDDGNTTFTHDPGDPANGMTVGNPGDTTRGVVFEWTSNSFYEWELIPSLRNLNDNDYVTFRACQATRHPNTTAVLEDLTFTVTLRDTGGTSSSINIGAYGGGLEEPYQRSGCGIGVGWNNEFEVIRIRISDFANNGSGINLGSVEAVRFDFGPSWGSAVGRIGVDELQLQQR